jgi:single-strand DNA-binding protein
MPTVSEEQHDDELNVAIVRGTCSSPAEVRTLPSGDLLAQLQVTTRATGETTSVPVAVLAPSGWVCDLDAGDEVLVVGHVRRRFFRAQGVTASRVEIQAELVARARDRRRQATARRRIEEMLETMGG